MKISAYICLGDPSWIEASISSYYTHVTKIIATYDREGNSWSGPKIDVEECVERLRKIDVDKKVMLVSGNFSLPENYSCPIDNDTLQRNEGVRIASQYGNWVLQLDTDEVASDWSVMNAHIEHADRNGYDALYYPSIYLYQLMNQRLGLEICRRGGVRQAGYPGPICVKSHSKLYHSRRSLGRALHVSCSNSYDTIIEQASGVYGEVLDPEYCITHLTRARSQSNMESKFRTWGHSIDHDYSADLKYWLLVRRYPWVMLFVSHILRGRHVEKFRLYKIPQSVQRFLALNTLDGGSI